MKEFKVKNIRNFITVGQARVLTMIFNEFNTGKIKQSGEGPCYELSRNPFFDLFLDIVKPEIEGIVGQSLVPTYAFARKYLKGSALPKHVDRDSCVYTSTLTLCGSDDSIWPIYYLDDGKNVKVKNKAGDLLVLKGCEIPHWREKLCSREKLQLFLHYVPNEQQYKEYFYDGCKKLSLSCDDTGLGETAAIEDQEQLKNDFFCGAVDAVEIIQQQRRRKHEK